MNADPTRIGEGYYYDQMPMGFRFRTRGRTITETDLVNYINLTWFTEEFFVDSDNPSGRAAHGRVVPGSMVYAFAEGLLVPSLQFTALAFLGAELTTKLPIHVGDTIHVLAEVIESRAVTKGNRGLVRTRNQVVNQHGEVVLVYTPLRLMRARDKDLPE
jgi:acyl dehydratase